LIDLNQKIKGKIVGSGCRELKKDRIGSIKKIKDPQAEVLKLLPCPVVEGSLPSVKCNVKHVS